VVEVQENEVKLEEEPQEEEIKQEEV